MIDSRPGHLRVLHIGKFYPPHKGGMESYLQNLCREMQEQAAIEVLVASDSGTTICEFDQKIRVSRSATWATLRSAPICPEMVGRIRSSQSDIVHLHWPHPTGLLAYRAAGSPGSLVVSYHSDVIRQRVLSRILDPALRHMMDDAKAVISFSPNYVESSPVLQEFRSKCHVIPHGVNPDEFAAADLKKVTDIRRQYGERLLLAVGRLVYYKGFDVLIRSMAASIRGNLLIVGTGPMQAELGRLAADLGVADRVHFLGEVSDIVSLYHACDVFVLPSVARSEAFGIVQLEAMACGRPVVNTRLETGVPYVSLDGVTGITVPPSDVDSLTQAVNLLLDNPSLRERYGEAGKRRVAEMFTVKKMAEKTMGLYEQVIASDKQTPVQASRLS